MDINKDKIVNYSKRQTQLESKHKMLLVQLNDLGVKVIAQPNGTKPVTEVKSNVNLPEKWKNKTITELNEIMSTATGTEKLALRMYLNSLTTNGNGNGKTKK
jgi:hypothetical protein